MPQHANFNFINQKVMSTELLLLNQTQLSKLLQMMIGHTWTAKMQSTLDFADALRSACFEEVPVDFPGFASKGIFKFSFLFSARASNITTPGN